MPLSAAERARKYREQLKQNPELYTNYLKKENERNEKRKAEGTIKLVSEMTSREKRSTRKAWRENKKRQKQRQNLTESLTPPSTLTTSPPFEIKARRESRKAACSKRKISSIPPR